MDIRAELNPVYASLKKNPQSAHLILVLIFLFQSALTLFYVLNDTRPPAWDQAAHLSLALVYTRLIGAGNLLDIIGVSSYYPPFFHLSTIPMYLFGISYHSSILVNLIFLAVLIGSVYGIGAYFFGRKTGLLSAAVISFFPVLISLQRDYLLDFALVAMVSLSTYLLLKTDGFRNRPYSMLFGLAVALTILTKWAGFIYLAGPFIAVLVIEYLKKPKKENNASQKRKKDARKAAPSHRPDDRTKNLIIAVIIGVLVAGIWYIPNAGSVIENVLFFSQAKTSQPGLIESDPQILSLSSLTFYPGTITTHISVFFSILFLIGLIYLFALTKHELRNQKIFFLLSIATPFIIFMLVRNKDPRYITPVLIFLAIVASFWVFRLDKKVLQICVISLILIVGVVQVSTLTFGYPDIRSPLYPAANYPRAEEWRVDDALGAVGHSLPATRDHQIIVIVLPDHQYVNGRTYEYYARLKNEPFSVYNGAYIPFDQLAPNLPRIDYIIYKDGGEVGNPVYGDTVQKMYAAFDQVKNGFRPVGTFPLPDGSTLIVYKNTGLPA